MNHIEGFLLLHKPPGITSFDCIYRVRRLVGRHLKVGHTGTLDAFASGLLIIAINRTATRHIQKMMELDKQYRARVKLGQLTDSLDFTGELLAESEPPPVTADDCQKSMADFGCQYLQTPPIYSALQYQGRRLSRMARGGEFSDEQLHAIAALKKRTVLIQSLTLEQFSFPYFAFQAHVSHGTYIRSLANDIAQKLGTYATTHELVRTAIGAFKLEQAVKLEELERDEDVAGRIIPVEDMLERIGLRS